MEMGYLEQDSQSQDLDLLRRIEALEQQLSKQQHVMETYETKLEQYEAKLADYSAKIEACETQQNTAETPTSEKTTNTDEIIELADAKRNGDLTETKYLRNSGDQQKIQPRLIVDNEEGPVAFHATNDKKNTDVGLNQHILFEDVHINAGNGFHALHGLFIAPRAGIYIFSTSIMTSPGHGDVIASIDVNGVDIARAYANGTPTFDQGSVTIVVQLKAGDEVWVKSHERSTATEYGDRFSSFMGSLIVEI